MISKIYRIGISMLVVLAAIMAKPVVTRAVPNGGTNGDSNPVAIDKYRDDGDAGIYEITLEVTGFEDSGSELAPVDVMLVLDRSGSMSGSKMTSLKENAKDFVDQLLAKHYLNRIAIVSFAGNQRVISDYWTYESGEFSNDADFLKGKIEGLSASGGTHLEGGIYQAFSIMTAASGTNRKVMIVMADGEPTYGFDWNGDRDDFDFDYTKRVGTGNSGSFTKDGTTYYLKDSVAEMASRVHDAGHDVYAIGLGVTSGSNAEDVLMSVGQDGYWSATTLNLGTVFDAILEQISFIIPGGYNPVVTDKLGDEFEFVGFSIGYPLESDEYASYNHGTRIITWTLGDNLTSKKRILKYLVKIHDGLDGGEYPTNEYATLSYMDPNENIVEEDFPVPVVPVPYRVLVEANPAAGGVVSGAGDYEEGDTVLIEAVANSGWNFIGWVQDGGPGASDGADYTFIMPAADQKWIAYFEQVAYTFTFDPNFGTEANVVESFVEGGSVTEASFNNAGFEFIGWTLDALGATPYTGGFSDLPPADVYIYAQWKAPVVEEEPEVYNLTYVTNQPGLTIPGVTFEAGDAITPVIPSAEGFEFLGWFVDNEFSAEFEEFASMPARDVTVYADWGEVLGDEDEEPKIPEMGDNDVSRYGFILLFMGLLAILFTKKDEKANR